MTKYCVTALVAVLLLYLGISFIEFNLDSSARPKDARIAFALLSAVICIGMLGTYLEDK